MNNIEKNLWLIILPKMVLGLFIVFNVFAMFFFSTANISPGACFVFMESCFFGRIYGPLALYWFWIFLNFCFQEKAALVMKQICLAFAYMHDMNIAHCDVKVFWRGIVCYTQENTRKMKEIVF